jgi:multidrug efflux pump subunit AcrA (membrane-fusion protein)
MTGNTKIKTILFCAALISFFSSCSKDKDAENPETSLTTQKVAVRAEKIYFSTLRTYVELNGNIQAKNSVQVYPLISGKVAGSKVNLGSDVKKGDVLVLVDASAPGQYYQMSQVVAPISGSVISIPPKNGQKVTPDTVLLTIGDLSDLEIKTYITEKYFSMLKKGQKAKVRVASQPDEVFSATVQSISPVVDEASRTVETILKLDEPDSRITAGMFSKIKLYLTEYENSLSVKEDAVSERDGKKVIFTVGQDGKAQIHEIKEGITVDGRIQILSGVNDGDLVITDGVSSVQDGMEVRIISE